MKPLVTTKPFRDRVLLENVSWVHHHCVSQSVSSCNQARPHESSHGMNLHHLGSQVPLNSTSNDSTCAFIHSEEIVLPLDCSFQSTSASPGSRVHVHLSRFSTRIQTIWGFYINPVTHSEAADKKRDVPPPLFANRILKQSQISQEPGCEKPAVNSLIANRHCNFAFFALLEKGG